jgi:hypothetical protein
MFHKPSHSKRLVFSTRCSPSGGRQAPSPRWRRPRLRVSCSPSPRYLFSVLPASRWQGHGREGDRRVVAAFLYDRLPFRRQDAGGTINASSPRGEGESFARGLMMRPSLVVVYLRNDGKKGGDCNRNVGIFKQGASALPLLGERVGVRGKEANSNSRRTTIPGTVKLHESPRQSRGFPNLIIISCVKCSGGCRE